MNQPTPIIMGSCYMDQGEDAHYITEAVKRAAKQNPEYYFFDFITHPARIEEAIELQRHFYAEVYKYLSDLPHNHVFTGVTCDKMIRPAAMALVIISKQSNADFQMKDINPEREASWK